MWGDPKDPVLLHLSPDFAPHGEIPRAMNGRESIPHGPRAIFHVISKCLYTCSTFRHVSVRASSPRRHIFKSLDPKGNKNCMRGKIQHCGKNNHFCKSLFLVAPPIMCTERHNSLYCTKHWKKVPQLADYFKMRLQTKENKSLNKGQNN